MDIDNETLLAAATSPAVSAEKLAQLMEMAEKVKDKEAAQSYNASMVQAQSEIPKIIATSANQQTNSRYVKLDAIIEVASPIWTAWGFALSFGEADASKEGFTRITLDVLHEAGHSKQYHRDLPLDDKGIKGTANKTQTHASGSTVSYGRRYLTCMVFNIATGDDIDGNSLVSQFAPKKEADPDVVAALEKASEQGFEFLLSVWRKFNQDERLSLVNTEWWASTKAKAKEHDSV